MEHKNTDEEFEKIIKESKNIRQALLSLGIRAKGGNYILLKNRAKRLNINIDHLILDQTTVLRNLLTDEEIIEAIKNSKSISETLKTLSFPTTSGNKKWINNKINQLIIDTSHWKKYPQTNFGGGSKKKPLSTILVENRYCGSSKLKERLINENLLENKCNECGIQNWRSELLVMHLDHINGDHLDNRLINLQLLCPNCHSQTKTYAGKNKGKLPLEDNTIESGENLLRIRLADIAYEKEIKNKQKFIKMENNKEKNIGLSLCKCGNNKNIKSMYCIDCYNTKRTTKIIWPSDEKLLDMLSKSAFTTVADVLGVSDNAIRKHLLRRGLMDTNPRKQK